MFIKANGQYLFWNKCDNDKHAIQFYQVTVIFAFKIVYKYIKTK